ncbi:MAG: ABC transporter permease, partial [Proteobacteria bacterium]|nr:ABC transporter permease [Pseudomonadota bacterium]
MRLSRPARAALVVLALIVVLAVAGPWLSPWQVEQLDWQRMAVPPGLEGAHFLGTDRLGRDLYVRTLAGVRVSLAIAALATAVSLSVGVAYGALAGWAGGRVDALMMRLVDVLYSLPYVFFVILLTVVAGRHLTTVFLAIGAVGWLTVARVVRGETARLKHREFVEAAQVAGVGTARILARHVVPNLAGPVLVYATLTVPALIVLESFLSFLGLGVAEPAASLGNLLAQGAQ